MYVYKYNIYNRIRLLLLLIITIIIIIIMIIIIIIITRVKMYVCFGFLLTRSCRARTIDLLCQSF